MVALVVVGSGQPPASPRQHSSMLQPHASQHGSESILSLKSGQQSKQLFIQPQAVLVLVVVVVDVVVSLLVIGLVALPVVVFAGFVLAGAVSLNNSHRVKICLSSKFFALGKSPGIRCSSISNHCEMPCHTPYVHE